MSKFDLMQLFNFSTLKQVNIIANTYKQARLGLSFCIRRFDLNEYSMRRMLEADGNMPVHIDEAVYSFDYLSKKELCGVD